MVIDGTAPVPVTAEWIVVNYDILGRHLDGLARVPQLFDRFRHAEVPDVIGRGLGAHSQGDPAHTVSPTRRGSSSE